MSDVGVRPSSGIPQLSRKSKVLLGLGLVVVLLLLFGPRLLGTYIDWLWFRSVDYSSVFSTVLVTRIIIFFVVALFVAAIIFASILVAYRTRSVFVPVPNPQDPVSRYRAIVMGKRKLFALGLPIVIGVICGLVAQSDWQMVQMFLHGGDFGVKDPQFNLDIGFYVFTLPFVQSVLSWIFVALFIAFFVALVTHYIFGGIRLGVSEGRLTRAARAQLAVIAGLFLLAKAVSYWFDRYALLSSSRKMPTFMGAGYTDIHAVLPSKLILMAIAVLCAVVFFAAIVLRDLRIPALATALMVLSSVLIGAVYPLIVEQFSVKPNAASKESEYITRNIAATRDAYGINNVKDGGTVTYENYPGSSTKSPAVVPADATTIENIRLLDPNVLSPTFTAKQQLKNFYGFPQMLNIDRYEVDGQLQDFVLAARELAPANFTGNQTDWINAHTVYTHGNGIVAAPANTVTDASADGQSTGSYPVFTVSDLNTESTFDELKVTQPRIYFGELIANTPQDYSIVGANGGPAREYDAENQAYTYTGKDGVPISNWINRLAFAAKYGERNILFSNAIGDGSKIIFNRDPRDRVQEVAPWLTTDANSYPAVVDGRIQWIVDGYTTLEEYPYAQRSSLDDLVSDSLDAATGRPLPTKEVSYIRNSVKATVDAYDGTVTLYQFDEKDPVLKAWMGVFPGTVKPKSAITDDLRAHLRYPEDLFKVQRQMLAKYHVDDPRDFFTNDAFWTVPTDPTVDNTTKNQPPYYLLLGDPKTAKPDFQLTSPMRGYEREFLSAYISASSNPDTYGQLLVRTLPVNSQTQGPNQAQNTMNSTPKVSNEVGILKQANKIIYGNLLTLPIADGGILYVGPMYTERNSTTGGTFPQLSRVLMSYTDPNGNVRVGYAATTAEALSQIFGADTAALATKPESSGASAPAAPAAPGTTPGATTEPTTTAPAPSTSTLAPLPSGTEKDAVAALDTALKNVKSAQSSGNFEAYGKALDELQAAVDNYEKVTGNTGN